MPRVLIVDDDKHSLEGVAEWVEAEGFESETAECVGDVRDRDDLATFDLAIVDLNLPDGTGLDVVGILREASDLEIVIATGHGSIDSAVETLKAGANDYMTKPIDLTRLTKILEKVRKTSDLRTEVDTLRGELRRLGHFGSMIGASPAMQQVYDLITKVAPSSATVLITGETGVGKELASRMVHELSPRSSRPFVAINCGAISENLIESELFGHEKGAFTGAEKRRRGLLEQADGGTLFLDEVTEMPLELQVNFLRVLETRQVRRVGGEEPIDVDVRVVAATNRDPRKAVEEGKLRQDLLYRLEVFPIELPPLRERGGDIGLLARHFLEKLNEDADPPRKLTESAIEKLGAHRWPGNVRELRNVIERAFLLATTKIEPSHIPLHVEAPKRGDGSGVSIPIGTSLDDAERELILATLEQVGGNRKAAAEILGCSLKTLYNRLRRYGSEEPAEEEE